MMSQYLLEQAGKACDAPGERLVILHDLDLVIERGESIAVVGASGSGKSTLLNLLGTLDTPTSGRVLFEGRDLATLSHDEKAHLRNKKLGFVFQFHHLLPEFSTVENVAMQALISGMARDEALERATQALDRVGLAGRRDHRVTTLSGGERQRAAIARAILLEPAVLLADEPTGNLDQRTGDHVAELLLHLNSSLGITLIVVTHNRDMARAMGRCLELRSGELYEETRAPVSAPAAV